MMAVLYVVAGLIAGWALARFTPQRRRRAQLSAGTASEPQERRDLLERFNLTTRTAGIATWGMDVRTRALSIDEAFWSLYGTTPLRDPRNRRTMPRT